MHNVDERYGDLKFLVTGYEQIKTVRRTPQYSKILLEPDKLRYSIGYFHSRPVLMSNIDKRLILRYAYPSPSDVSVARRIIIVTGRDAVVIGIRACIKRRGLKLMPVKFYVVTLHDIGEANIKIILTKVCTDLVKNF